MVKVYVSIALIYSYDFLAVHCQNRKFFIVINNIFKFQFIKFFKFFFLIMAKYRLNTTKYVLKWPKKHQKVPKFNIITLSTLSDPDPQNVDNLPFFWNPSLSSQNY